MRRSARRASNTDALRQLATDQSDAEDHAAARATLDQALPILTRTAGPRSDEMVEAMTLDGWLTSSLGHRDAGVARMREARDLAAALHGRDSEAVARIENDLLVALGDADESLDLAKHVATVYRATLGETSYGYSLAMYNVGNLLYGHARWSEAADVFATVVPLQERLLGPTHPETALTYRQVARLAAARGDFVEARARMLKAIAALEAGEASRVVGAALARNQLANIERMSGHFAEAARLGDQAIAALRSTPGSSNLALALETVAAAYRGAGDRARALTLAREAVRLSEGQDQRWLGASLMQVGATLLETGDAGGALAALRRAPAAFEAAGQAASTDAALAAALLAEADGSAPAPDRERRFRAALASFAVAAPAEHGDAIDARLSFACFLRDEQRLDEARAVVDEAVAALARSRGVDDARVALLRTFRASLDR